MSLLCVDLCVIGAGAAGLSVAVGAAQMGANVVLVEPHEMGGDCLNYGCVPSKSLLAVAKRAHQLESDPLFGIVLNHSTIDFQKVHDYVQGVIATIAPHDSVERMQGLGIKVLRAAGRFISPQQFLVGDTVIQAKRFVVATGSSPMVPLILGLAQVPYLTNETIFALTVKPERLIIIGGGPIGCELAQAYLRLGVPVTVLEERSILPKDDPELVDLIRQALIKEKCDLHEGIRITAVSQNPTVGQNTADIQVTWESQGETRQTVGSHLLIATGRKANVEHLDLEQAGVQYHLRGIIVDRRLRTSNKRIFAAGDVVGNYQFTHVASYHASIVIQNALFHFPARVNYRALPWITYTDPELAQVGLSEQQLKKTVQRYQVLEFPAAAIDRMQIEQETLGMIKVLVSPRGQILGATIVGAQAGELIFPWVLAIQNRLKIKALATLIAPYPTRSELNKRVAGEFYLPTLYSPTTKRIVRWLNKLLP